MNKINNKVGNLIVHYSRVLLWMHDCDHFALNFKMKSIINELIKELLCETKNSNQVSFRGKYNSMSNQIACNNMHVTYKAGTDVYKHPSNMLIMILPIGHSTGQFQ
jgi:hypothetical protein